MSCSTTGKYQHLFEEEAEAEAARLTENNARHRSTHAGDRIRVRAYACSACGQYHTTSQPLRST